MRNYDSATLDAINARAGLVPHRLIWVAARNRETAATEYLGLWTGEDDVQLSVEGQVRSYVGAGAVLQGDAITAGSGLEVRVHVLALAAVAPEVEDLVKGYETRFAPVEIHRALFDPATRALIGAPHRIFRGMIDQIDFPTDPAGGNPACTVQLVSETRILTRTLALKKSDDSHRRRDAGDGFRKYGDISGSVPVYWGEARAAEVST